MGQGEKSCNRCGRPLRDRDAQCPNCGARCAGGGTGERIHRLATYKKAPPSPRPGKR